MCPRNSLGHCESSTKEVEKQIRVFMSYTRRAHHQCDSERRAAWTMTQRTVNVEEHTSLFKWTSNDDRGEVARFVEWSWFRSIAKTSKLEEQRIEAHLVGWLKRADEHSLVIRSLTRSAGAGRRQARNEKWHLDSVKAMLNRIRGMKTSTEIDTSVDRQKYITNQALDKHKRAPLCTKCAWGTGAHCRARFEIIWTNELSLSRSCKPYC